VTHGQSEVRAVADRILLDTVILPRVGADVAVALASHSVVAIPPR